MANTGLNGPYILTKDNIAKVIKSVSPGAYALGVHKTDGIFYLDYVGRSDIDVGGRLGDHVGKYTHFKFGYFSIAKAAFEKECHMYHDFSPGENKVHPARNGLGKWECPRCTIFDDKK